MTEAGRDGKRWQGGLVLEPAGVEDPNGHRAYVGLERAVHELGVRGRVLTPARAASRVAVLLVPPVAAAGAHPVLSPG